MERTRPWIRSNVGKTCRVSSCKANLSSGKLGTCQSERKIGPIASMRMSRLCNLCIHSHDAMIRSAADMKRYACGISLFLWESTVFLGMMRGHCSV